MKSWSSACASVLILVGSLAVVPAARAGCDNPTLAEQWRLQIGTDCQCDAYPNHGQYVRCVVSHVRDAIAAGLPTNCKGTITRCAARSTCGKKTGFSTCCRALPGTCTAGLCQDKKTSCTDSSTCPAVTKCGMKSSPELCTAIGGSPGTGSCCDTVCSVSAAQ